jgi:hypothetical protein
MAWETRHGDRYYYRARWVNGRVVKEYLGAGPIGELAAQADELDRAERRAEREEEDAALEPLDAASALLGELGAGLAAAVAATMTAAGYHRHHRGEWRRRRT